MQSSLFFILCFKFPLPLQATRIRLLKCRPILTPIAFSIRSLCHNAKNRVHIPKQNSCLFASFYLNAQYLLDRFCETVWENYVFTHLKKKKNHDLSFLKGCSGNSKENLPVQPRILHSGNQTPDRWNELLSSPGCIWNPFICGFQCTVTPDRTAGHLMTVFICPKHKLVPEISARLLTDHYHKTYRYTSSNYARV